MSKGHVVLVCEGEVLGHSTSGRHALMVFKCDVGMLCLQCDEKSILLMNVWLVRDRPWMEETLPKEP